MPLSSRLGIISSICVGFLGGCLLAEAVPWLKLLPVLLIGFAACLVLIWPKPGARVSILAIIGVILGMLAWHHSLKVWNVSPPIGRDIAIVGWLEGPLQLRQQGPRGIITVLEMHDGGSTVHLTGTAHIVVDFPDNAHLNYGDELSFTTKLHYLPKFGSFDGVRYWRAKGVQATAAIKEFKLEKQHARGLKIAAWIFDLKALIRARVLSILPGTEGVLLLGLLFGDQGQLPRVVANQFRILGISHLTAVSGYNLTIIALWPLALAGLIPKKGAILVAAMLVGVFVIFTGAPSSIVRAAIMAFVVLFGKYLGRPPHTLFLITITATVMAIANPFVVKDDAGFALSFLAFFGLVELGPLIAKGLGKIKLGALRTIFSETLGAQLATLPYLLGVFGQFAYSAPLANALILPLIPLIMLVGLSLVILALVPATPFLKLLGLLYFPLHGMLWIIDKASGIPHISSTWPKGGYFPWYLGLVIFGWWVWVKRQKKKAPHNR